MTDAETEARALLRRRGYDDLEPWLASQRWQVSLRGWHLSGLKGCRFDIEIVSDGRLRITARPAGGDPHVWFVPFRR